MRPTTLKTQCECPAKSGKLSAQHWLPENPTTSARPQDSKILGRHSQKPEEGPNGRQAQANARGFSSKEGKVGRRMLGPCFTSPRPPGEVAEGHTGGPWLPPKLAVVVVASLCLLSRCSSIITARRAGRAARGTYYYEPAGPAVVAGCTLLNLLAFALGGGACVALTFAQLLPRVCAGAH